MKTGDEVANMNLKWNTTGVPRIKGMFGVEIALARMGWMGALGSGLLGSILVVAAGLPASMQVSVLALVFMVMACAWGAALLHAATEAACRATWCASIRDALGVYTVMGIAVPMGLWLPTVFMNTSGPGRDGAVAVITGCWLVGVLGYIGLRGAPVSEDDECPAADADVGQR